MDEQDHSKSHDLTGILRSLLLIGIVAVGMVLALTGVLPRIAGVPVPVLVAIVGGLPLLHEAVVGLLQLRLSADLAVCVAAGAAIYIGQGLVAAEVILIMLVGGLLEALAVRQTRGAIRALMAVAPRTATRVREGGRETVPIEQVCAADIVQIGPGERVPVDGTVRAGHSTVNRAVLTGESLPAEVGPGDEVLAGCLNGSGVLDVTTVRVGDDTAFGRILHLVEAAERQRAPTQRLADRYATFFLPLVIVCAAGTYLGTRELVRAVSVLVIACPCALVLATPTAIAAGIGRLARRGVLVKGGAALEALARARTICFDKTGTLTQGRLGVTDVVPVPPTPGDGLLATAAAVELASDHPVAQAIVTEAQARGLSIPEATEVTADPGRGLAGRIHGELVRVGSVAYLESQGPALAEAVRQQANTLSGTGKTVVVVRAGDTMLGLVAARDQVRPEAAAVMAELRQLSFASVRMLTGDTPGAAACLAREVGIDEVHAGLLPEDKTRIVREAGGGRRPVVMVGDGINDAAALVTADVGIALTDVGSDAAIEAADIAVFGEHSLDKLPEAVRTSRRVLRTARQNIVLFALLLNGFGVAAAASGRLGPVAAAVFHQISSLFVVGNSLRLLFSGAEIRRGLGRWWVGLGHAAVAWRRPLTAAAVLVYLASGVFAIRPDEVGVVRRFGRVVQPLALPGLHVRLPWPMSRLTRVAQHRVERVEVGFRATPAPATVPPSAYEWNLQHRGGRYEKVPNESVVTCGDQALLDINAVVQYRTCDPAKRLFRARDPERLLAVAAEGALREVVARTALIHLLTERRRETEAAAEARLAAILATYDVGIGVVGVRLQDVHPPLEVVDAFRRVVDGLEQKEAKINQAQAYASEQVTLARGTAVTVREAAAAEAAAVVARSTGEAGRFVRLSEARTCGPAAPAVTDVQLHCEALEAALANARLTVLDPGVPGPRGLVLLDPAAQRRGTGIAVTPLTDPEGRASESPSAGDRPGTVGGPIPR